jgi:hypothetical protein
MASGRVELRTIETNIPARMDRLQGEDAAPIEERRFERERTTEKTGGEA